MNDHYAPLRAAITGIKHSGKSTVGRAAASLLRVPFHDLDEVICEHEGVAGARELYRAVGAERFRAIELEMVESFCALPGSLLLAAGGGIADNGAAIAALAGSFHIVYLVESEVVLYDRIMASGRPPFLPESGTREAFARLYRRRDLAYRRWAHSVLEASGTIPKVADALASLLSGNERR